MKIAIQGHSTRGKEVIQILKSLGGKNNNYLSGDSDAYYYINNDLEGIIQCHSQTYVNKYCKKYTLEEFEKVVIHDTISSACKELGISRDTFRINIGKQINGISWRKL